MNFVKNNEYLDNMKKVQTEGYNLFEKKNKDYGNSFEKYGPIGVIVRMQDKINRLVSVTDNGINMIEKESIRDTLIDLHNYSAMAIMLLDKNKKSEKKQPLYKTKSNLTVEIKKVKSTYKEPFKKLEAVVYYD